MRMFILEEILKVYKEKRILDNVVKVGEIALRGFKKLAQEFPSLVNSARGRGLILAIDVVNSDTRGKILDKLKRKGKKTTNFIFKIPLGIITL